MPKITELKPSHIRFADKLLCQNPEIQTISLNDFEAGIALQRQIPNYNWIEHIEGATNNNDTLMLNEAIFLEMKMATQQLVICNMGEPGLGVFTSQKIKKGTVITSYSGEYKDMNTLKNDSYAFRVDNHAISSKTCGNIASFIQHMPSPETYFHSFEGVGFANVRTVQCGDNLMIKALRDIEANEMLSLNYGMQYWAGKGMLPLYFDRYGNSLGDLNMRASIYSIYERLYYVVQAILGSTYKAKHFKTPDGSVQTLEHLCLECEAEIKQVFEIKNEWDRVQKCYQAQCAKIMNRSARICGEEFTNQPMVDIALNVFLRMHKDVLKLVPRKYLPLIDCFLSRNSLMQHTNEKHHPLSLASYLETINIYRPERPLFCTPVVRLCLPKDYYNFNDARYYYESPAFLASKDEVALTKGAEAYKEEQYESAIQWWQIYLRKLRTDQSKFEHYAVDNQLFPATKEICSQLWNLGRAYQKSANFIEAEYCMFRALCGAQYLQLSQTDKYLEGWTNVKNSLDQGLERVRVFSI